MEVDPVSLIKCSREALKIAADVTKLVRQAWEVKDRLPMLEMHIGSQLTENQVAPESA